MLIQTFALIHDEIKFEPRSLICKNLEQLAAPRVHQNLDQKLNKPPYTIATSHCIASPTPTL